MSDTVDPLSGDFQDEASEVISIANGLSCKLPDVPYADCLIVAASLIQIDLLKQIVENTAP